MKQNATQQLVLATLAFLVCFYAWALLGPLGPDIQDEIGLSDFQESAMVAVPGRSFAIGMMWPRSS